MKNIIQSLCRHITTSESVVTVVHGFPQSTYGRVVGELGVGVLADHGRAGVAGAGQCSSKLAVIILTFARSSHSPL